MNTALKIASIGRLAGLSALAGSALGSGCVSGASDEPERAIASVAQAVESPCGEPSFTPGDFNGDGKTDVIITTSSGSSWFFSNGNGTWSIPYTRSDLNTGAGVSFTPGDFNGDGKTDVIITTSSGSYWYFSNGNGTWTIPYVRSDLPLHYVSFTPGDFNGDGKTDVVITKTSGSTWYFSKGDGTWTTPYTRADLPLGYDPSWGPFSTVSFTPGDFNGDGKTDLVIATASGSYWYFSNGAGGFLETYVLDDLPFGDVAYTPGDFNGDGKTDLVITRASGSYWYYSNGDGTWGKPYVRTDLPLGFVSYDAGDFNGDGKDDLLIQVWGGQRAYWYLSNGSGGWSSPYSMDASIASDTDYDFWTTGDFNGDGKTDLILEEATGSFWYFSKVTNGQYSTQLAYSRPDLDLDCVIK
ncbi:MAG TPA: VCBS repeat-containing protein [Kofleriaceae bacterium]|nr:VCBS repeat-containing protein [Kofleriaceae bacterium]